jgi:GDP-mannose 6-dehydrogenase
MKVVVVGLGHLGCIAAACLADAGHEIVAVDCDAGKVGKVLAGRSPVLEPGLAELIGKGRARGRLQPTTDLVTAVRSSAVTVVCVGTPSQTNGDASLAALEQATGQIGRALAGRDGFHVLLVKSTVPPGTTEERLLPILHAQAPDLRARVGIAVCPDFLREGSGIADFRDPPYTVIGSHDARAAATARELFSFTDRPTHMVDFRTAEAVKYASNAFHAVKVVFANEIGRLCRELEVDARTVMDLFRRDDRLNLSGAYLHPGFSFGGSCLPKDLRTVLHQAELRDVDLPMLAAAVRSNAGHINHVARTVLDRNVGSATLLGLSFKPGTADLRQSPFVELAAILVDKGVELRIYDPEVDPAALAGENRHYVDARLPGLDTMVWDDPLRALHGVDCALVGRAGRPVIEALLAHPPAHVVDLSGRLGSVVEALPGYVGIAW